MKGWHLRVLGLGYARTFATTGLGPFGTLASGVDLAAGYNTAYGSATATGRVANRPFVSAFSALSVVSAATLACDLNSDR